MSFYLLTKSQRQELVAQINSEIFSDIKNGALPFSSGRGRSDRTLGGVHLTPSEGLGSVLNYFSDEDTYIRKAAYQSVGKIYRANKSLQKKILELLSTLFNSPNEKIRQTAINAAGEIGMTDFAPVENLMEQGLFDAHHSIRNAVIGSIKKMGEKNPEPVLAFAKRFLHHENKEIRREICHGIELRGRKHPQDILPLLKELQHDKTARVRNTLVHVLGQIAYKKGCLETVVTHLQNWENKELVADALAEIIDVHHRYKNFAVKTQEVAIQYIERNFPK